MEKLVIVDGESYKDWITEISNEFKRSQIRAAVKINDEMLRFYWKLGKDISTMSKQYGYGSGFYKILSDDLKKVLPEIVHKLWMIRLSFLEFLGDIIEQ